MTESPLSGDAAEDSGGSEPKILKVGILAAIHHLDPLQAQDADSAFTLRQTLETPYGVRHGTTEIEPALFVAPIEEGDEAGRQVFRGTLRDDVLFWDGTLLQANDLVACLEKVPLIYEQAEVEAIGREIVFRMKQRNAGFEHVLFHSMCGVYKRIGNRVIGTGPFMPAEDSEPHHVRLVRNPHYRQPPKLDGLDFVKYETDEEGRPTPLLEALESGEVHFCNTLSKDDINKLSGVRKSFLPGTSTAMLYLNTRSPRLADARLRRAVARAIDRVEVARTSYSNALAFAASSILPRTMGAADDALDYSPTEARKLLQEARDAGVEIPEKLTLLMVWAPRSYVPHPDRFREAITQQLGEIGIRVDPIFTETSSEFLERIMRGEQDMTLGGWIADTMDPYDFLESNLASSRIPDRTNIAVANNNGRLASDEMDRALAEFRADHGANKLEEVMRIMSEEAPLVPLSYGPTAAVWSFEVKNFQPSPLTIFPFTGVDLEV